MPDLMYGILCMGKRINTWMVLALGKQLGENNKLCKMAKKNSNKLEV